MTGTTLLHPSDPFPALVVYLPGGQTVRLAHDLAGRFDVARLVMPSGGMRVSVRHGTRDAICRLYDDLWDQPPPEDSPRSVQPPRPPAPSPSDTTGQRRCPR